MRSAALAATAVVTEDSFVCSAVTSVQDLDDLTCDAVLFLRFALDGRIVEKYNTIGGNVDVLSLPE
jgi:hypothetical protein